MDYTKMFWDYGGTQYPSVDTQWPSTSYGWPSTSNHTNSHYTIDNEARLEGYETIPEPTNFGTFETPLELATESMRDPAAAEPVDETAEDVTDVTAEVELAEGETVGTAALEMPELGPYAIAWGIGKAIGGAITDKEYANQMSALNQQTISNKQVPGMIQTNADRIQSWNAAQINQTKSWGDFGSNFGIVGQAIAHAVAANEETPIPQADLLDAWSSQGKIDSMSNGVNISNDAADIPLSEMTDGAQTSEDSNAMDTTPT